MVTRLRSGRILSLSFFARLSWQVVPTALGRYLSDPDRKKADHAMQAMMMKKIVIADLEKAYAGWSPKNLHRRCRTAPPEFGWTATISKPGRSDEGGLK
jgi:hypothetical protein